MKINKAYVANLFSSLLILLFVYTAVSKLLKYSVFVWSISQSLPIGKFATVIGWLIPIIELFTSILLFFPKTRLRGFIASTLLMVVFDVYISVMLLTVSKLPCSCGGVVS